MYTRPLSEVISTNGLTALCLMKSVSINLNICILSYPNNHDNKSLTQSPLYMYIDLFC